MVVIFHSTSGPGPAFTGCGVETSMKLRAMPPVMHVTLRLFSPESPSLLCRRAFVLGLALCRPCSRPPIALPPALASCGRATSRAVSRGRAASHLAQRCDGSRKTSIQCSTSRLKIRLVTPAPLCCSSSRQPVTPRRPLLLVLQAGSSQTHGDKEILPKLGGCALFFSSTHATKAAKRFYQMQAALYTDRSMYPCCLNPFSQSRVIVLVSDYIGRKVMVTWIVFRYSSKDS